MLPKQEENLPASTVAAAAVLLFLVLDFPHGATLDDLCHVRDDGGLEGQHDALP